MPIDKAVTSEHHMPLRRLFLATLYISPDKKPKRVLVPTERITLPTGFVLYNGENSLSDHNIYEADAL